MILLDLFWVFFLIGAFTFGGGYAMIAVIQQQVEAHGWMQTRQLIDFIAIAESTPGPIAVNMATFVGTRMGGFWGAVCATVGVVLPSFLVILIVARCYQAFRQSRWVKGVMSGLKPAVIGLIGGALVSVAAAVFAPSGWSLQIFAEPATWLWLAVGAGMLLLAFRFKKLHPVVIICLCGLIGIGAGYLGL